MSTLSVSTNCMKNVSTQSYPHSQLFTTCELCILSLSKNEMMRPFCTNKCLYCNKNVCAQCCASAAELPFELSHNLSNTSNDICFECIITNRHKIIMKSIYKAIGNNININIINIIALFAIDECNNCNNIYPKSWSIIQPNIVTNLVHNIVPLKCTSIASLFTDKYNHNEYKLKYCKACNILQERDVIFISVYNSSVCVNILKYSHTDIEFELYEIIDIITLYSIGRIFSCSNFNNCQNDIIINNNFDGLIDRKDINGMTISRSIRLDTIFCYQCTIDEHRCDRIKEKCSYCNKYTLFGSNKTCNKCLKRFCDKCLDNENNCYLEKKYYFTMNGNLKYYQYCMECTYDIYDDIDILDCDDIYDDIDFYQQLINDHDYTEYKSVDQFYYFGNNYNNPILLF